MSNLKNDYKNLVVPKLITQFEYKNIHEMKEK